MARLSKLSRSIAGSVAIVTGAASGMGRATAQLFADEGAKVAAIDLNGADLKKVVGEIEGAGGTVRGWKLDLSDRAAIDRVTAEIADHFGGIDILVNNAGISIPIAIDNEQYEAKVTVLGEYVQHHVKEEEQELFPKARQHLSAKRLTELGEQIATRKEALSNADTNMQAA